MSNTDSAAGHAGEATTNPFVKLVNELGVTRLSIMAAVTGAVIVGVVYFSGQLTRPPMGLLFGNLDAGDAANITQQLQSEHVPFQLKGDGGTIFVPEDKVLTLRMQFASKGMPAGQDVGYEIFDNQSAFGQTSFMQNLNRQRALEGELARTIRSLSQIDEARVHLALPEHELFQRDNKKPTASIVVKTRGTLDKETVGAIQHLVASSVEGLDPEDVSIVDERGTLLAAGGKSDAAAMATIGIDDKQAALEDRLRQRVLSIVNKYTGTGNAQAQVAAELNFDRVTQQSTVYDPDKQVVASTTTTTDNDSSHNKDSQAQGVTVSDNLPGNQTANSNGNGSGTSSTTAHTHEQDQTTYQNSQTVRTEVTEPGSIERLSVAVLVDGTYTNGKDGKTTYKPRSKAELAQIKSLVEAGIGYNAKRGDTVTVENMPFAQLSVPQGAPEKQPFLGLTKADYIYIGQIAGLFILGLVTLLFVIRPMILRLLRPTTAAVPQIAGGQLAVAGPGRAAPSPEAQQLIAEAQAKGQPLPMLTQGPGVGAQIDLAQIEGQVKESSVRKVGEVVEHHPDESVAILRSWMQQGD